MIEEHVELNPNEGISLWRAVGIALWLLAAQMLVAIPILLFEVLNHGSGDFDNMSGSSLGLILILSFPLAVWMVLRKNKLDKNSLFIPKPFLLPFISALILTFSLSFVVGDLLTYLPGYEGMLENYGGIFGEIKPIYLLLGGVFIGPICEEIIFRGVILKELLRKYEPWKAILFSALIFGVIHGIAIQIIYAFVLGLVLGWIYYRTRSLWFCIILHILNNGIAFLGDSESSESLPELIGSDLSYYGVLGGAAIVAIIAAVFFVKGTPKTEAVTNR